MYDDSDIIFRTLGEQLKAIIDMGTPGRPQDKRLQLRSSGLAESTPSAGGFLIQSNFVDMLLKPVWDEAEIPRRVSKIRMSNGNETTIPAIDEDSRADGSRWGGVQMYWLCEGEEKEESKPKIRQVNIKLGKLIGLCYVTEELAADSSLLETLIPMAFQAEADFMLTEAIIRGTGAGMPLGIINAPCTITHAKETAQAADTVVAANIIGMWARLIPTSRRNAVWLINQNIEPQLHGMVIIVGGGAVPIYQPAGQVSDSPYSLLFNRPVIPVEQAATLGDLGDITLADLSKYVMVDGGSLRRDVSIHVRFIYDERILRFVYRVDGQPILNRPVTPKNSSMTLSHFVILEARPTVTISQGQT